MASQRSFSVGRTLLVLAELVNAGGSYVFDLNETHVLNPRWPPHAKFHNGQTMTFGVLQAAIACYLIWRSSRGGKAQMKSDFGLAAVISSMYPVAGFSAILYPGTEWNDPEFPQPNGPAQIPIWCTLLGLIWSAYAIEMWQLG